MIPFRLLRIVRVNVLNTFNKGIKSLKYLFFAVLLFNGCKISADEINPYTVLEVPKTASPADIVRAYRKQALKWHPDRNSDSNAEQRMKEVNEAYEILKDPVQRHIYDRDFSVRSEQGRRNSTYNSSYIYDSPELDRRLSSIIDKLAKMKPGFILQTTMSNLLKLALNVTMNLFDTAEKNIFLSSLLQKIESQYSQHPPHRESIIFRNIQLNFGKKTVLDLVLTIDFIQNTETAERFLSYFSSNTSKEVIDSVLFVAQNLPSQSLSRVLQSVIENNPKRKLAESALEELSKINPEKIHSTLISIAVNASTNIQNRLYALNYIVNHFELSETEVRALQQAQAVETNKKIKRALSQIIQQHSQPNSSPTNSSSIHSILTSKITKAVSMTLSWRSLSKEEQAKILQDFTSVISQQISRLNPFHNSSAQDEELSQKEFTAVAVNHSLNIKIRRIALEVLSWRNVIEEEKKQVLKGLMSIVLDSSEDKKLRIRALNILNSAHTDLSPLDLDLLNSLTSNKKEPKSIRSQAKKIVKRAVKRGTASSSKVCEKTMSRKGS